MAMAGLGSGLLPQLIECLASRAGPALHAPRFSLHSCTALAQPHAGGSRRRPCVKVSTVCLLPVGCAPAHHLVVPCRCYSRTTSRRVGRRMNVLVSDNARWQAYDASLPARRRVVLLLMVHSCRRYDSSVLELLSFDLGRARAGCLICLTLVGIGLASAIAYRACTKYFVDPAAQDEVQEDNDAERLAVQQLESPNLLTKRNLANRLAADVDDDIDAGDDAEDDDDDDDDDSDDGDDSKSFAVIDNEKHGERRCVGELGEPLNNLPRTSSSSLLDESLTGGHQQTQDNVVDVDAGDDDDDGLDQWQRGHHGNWQAGQEVEQQLAAGPGEPQAGQKAAQLSHQDQQHQFYKILSLRSRRSGSAPTPSDPLSLSDASGDEDHGNDDSNDDDDDSTLAQQFRQRQEEVKPSRQSRPTRVSECEKEDKDSTSCGSSQLGSLHRGVSLFSNYAASSSAGTSTSCVMDDSGVDFLCDTGESRALDCTLVKLDRLMESLEQVSAEAGGMCQSCVSLQEFSDNLHSGVAEFDRNLQRAQLLCDEVSASDQQHQQYQASGFLSNSSSFGLDCDLASCGWSAYDEALQDKISEIFFSAGLDEILAEDAEGNVEQPEVTNVGPLVSIMEFASSDSAGCGVNADRIRRGCAKIVADGSASFIRRIRNDQYSALRAVLFSFFLQCAELPNTCQYWLEHLSRSFTEHPWLENWSLGCHQQQEQQQQQQQYEGSAVPELSACVRQLYAQLASVRSQPGSLYREWEVLQIFNAELDLQLMEAAKAMLMMRAVELHSACECGQAELPANLLFCRQSSASLRDLFDNHINPIGHSAGLAQPELLLLADLLQVRLQVYRPFAYGEGEDFVVSLGNVSASRQLRLVSEYDNCYHVLLS